MEAAASWKGKFFLVAVLLSTLLTSGCKFFGELEEKLAQPPGVLEDGSVIVGSWVSSVSSTSLAGTPNYAVTETYTFDPTGNVRIELRDQLSGGVTCLGYGVYRNTTNRDVVVYIQAASPSNCAFNGQIYLSNIEVRKQSIRFTDLDSQITYDYFAERKVATIAPIGVWDFDSAGGINGEGGIDYLFFDHRGYFVLQTSLSDGQGQFIPYLLVGYYSISGSQVSLTFFDDMDPTNVTVAPLVYKQFITDGQVLQLVEETPDGDVVHTGYRL